MKRLFKCLVLSLVLSMFLGMTSFAAVSKVQITAPTKKASMTITRSNKNVTKQIKASVKVTGKSKKTLTYKSSDTDVATVNSKGKVTFKQAGKVTITVASKENPKKKDTLKFTVKQLATAVSAQTKSGAKITKKKGIQIAKGKTLQVEPVFKPVDVSSTKVTYKSSNSKVASVDKKGNVKGKKAGKANITITTADGSKKSFKFPVKVVTKAVKSITVDQTEVTLNLKGTKTATIKATVATTGSTANKNVVWASKDEEIATVTQKGVIKAVAPGTTTVTVTALDGTNKKATVKVTVIDYVAVAGVTLDQTALTLATDNNYGYNVSAKVAATVAPETATNKEVTFASSNDKVATVAADGTITAKASGSAVITATADGVSATANVVVVNGSKWNPVENSGDSSDKNVQIKSTTADKTVEGLNAFFNDLGDFASENLGTNGYNISGSYNLKYTSQAGLELTNAGSPVDIAAKLTSGIHVTNGVLGKVTPGKFGSLHLAIVRSTQNIDFGNITLIDGSTTYEFTNLSFNAAEGSLTATVNNTAVKVKFGNEANNDSVYVSSVGQLDAVEALLQAVLGSNLQKAN